MEMTEYIKWVDEAVTAKMESQLDVGIDRQNSREQNKKTTRIVPAWYCRCHKVVK